MKNFHIKSIILGIGIGIVLTSIISLIYLTGEKPKLSREEIIAQAKAYGMIEKVDILKDKTLQQEQKNEEANRPEDIKIPSAKPTGSQVNPSPTPTLSPAPAVTAQPKQEEQEPKISINPGDSSEVVAGKLLQAGLINDKSAFIKEITAMGLSGEINIGEYKIKKDTDLRTIIKLITTRK